MIRRGDRRPQLKTPDDVMTLTEHLGELRVRIIRIALGAWRCSWCWSSRSTTRCSTSCAARTSPCATDGAPSFCGLSVDESGEPTLFAFGPLEGFATRLRISMWGGIVLATPVIMWQVWRFIVPALHSKERKMAIPFIFSSVALFLLGGALAYFTLEKALEFLISWSGQDVTSAFRIADYVNLVLLMIGAFGVGLAVPGAAGVPAARRRHHASATRCRTGATPWSASWSSPPSSPRRVTRSRWPRWRSR